MKAFRHLLILSLLFVTFYGRANNRKDSLLHLVDTTESVDLKLAALNTLAWDARVKSTSEADSIARVALALAEENNIEKEIANSTNTLGVVRLMRGQFEEGIKLLEKCATINLKAGHYTPYIDNKMNISLAYYFQGKLDSSIVLLTNLYKLADSLNRPRNVALILGNLGPIYQERGFYLKSLEIAIKNIETAKELKDTLMLSKVFNSVALLYDYFGEFDKSIYYHKKGLKLDSLTGSIKGLSSTLGNLGEVYRQIGKSDSACTLFMESLRLAQQYGDSGSIIGQLINVSLCLEEQNQRDSAFSLISYCFDASKRLNFGYHIAGSLKSKGYIEFQRKNYSNSVDNYNEALIAARNDGYAEVEEFSLKGLSEAYNALEKSDSAYKYLQEYLSFSDSLKTNKAKQQIELLETQYRTAEKENRILALNEEKTQDKLELNRQRNWMIILGAGILIIALVSLLIIQNNKQRSRAEKDAAIIAEQEKGTKAIFLMQEEERKRISKDLHDGVGQQLAGLKINFQVISEKLKTENPERYKEFQLLDKIVSDSAAEIRNISHTMMPLALTKQGVIVAIQEMLHKSFSLSDVKYRFEHYGVEKRLPENVEVSLYRIAQELINNIIKHSSAKNVNVQLMKTSGKVMMIVEDDGSGITYAKSDGHGLLNMKSRINSLHGEMNLEPSPNSGTLATIRIPLDPLKS